MSMGHRGFWVERARHCLLLRLPSLPEGVPLLCGRGRHPSSGGAVRHHSSVPGEPPGTLWGVGQQADIGMDASSVFTLCLSFPLQWFLPCCLTRGL